MKSVIISLAVAILSFPPVWGEQIPFPSKFVVTPGEWHGPARLITALRADRYIDLPDDIANRRIPGGSATLYLACSQTEFSSPWDHCLSLPDPETPVPNSTYGEWAGNRGLYVWGSVYNWLPVLIPAPLPTCLYPIAYINNQRVWVGACVPIDAHAVPTCSIAAENILLEHRSTLGGDILDASSSVPIRCDGPATGRLYLPGATDHVAIGGGTATLRTDDGPLGTTLAFPTGETRLILRSTLTGVEPGDWEATTVLLLDMD